MGIGENIGWTPFLYHFGVGGAIFAVAIILYYLSGENRWQKGGRHTPVAMCIVTFLFYLLGTFVWQWLAMQGPTGGG